MSRHYFFPTPHKIYTNKNGLQYICLSSKGHFKAKFQALTKSKWTFTAHGCQIYDDGMIEWDSSTGGYFADNEKPVNSWTDYLSEEVAHRLGECRSLRDDVPILVDAKWKYMCLKGKDKDGFTKEDALVEVLDLLDCNNQFFDLTKEEYESLIK